MIRIIIIIYDGDGVGTSPYSKKRDKHDCSRQRGLGLNEYKAHYRIIFKFTR